MSIVWIRVTRAVLTSESKTAYSRGTRYMAYHTADQCFSGHLAASGEMRINGTEAVTKDTNLS